MPRKRSSPGAISLPKGVQCQVVKGREYYYFQTGRGTANAGPRVRLPDDPRTPDFWNKVRELQGAATGIPVNTVEAALDKFLIYIRTTKSIVKGTRYQYEHGAGLMRKAWGPLPLAGLKPAHVLAMMQAMQNKPGAANNFLGAVRAFQSWAIGHGHLDHSLTLGVKPYRKHNGHKPWTAKQIEAALASLTGPVRRGVVLYLYTGMRGSDAVRMGWDFIDEGGLSYAAQKTGREVYCPILPELEREMASWARRPGPFLYQEGGRADGRPYTRKLFSKHFAEQRDKIPELAGVTLHGLRCTAILRLRRVGLSTTQIQDIVGMSLAMIERYCRFSNRKESGHAALEKYNREMETLELKNLAKLANKNSENSDG